MKRRMSVSAVLLMMQLIVLILPLSGVWLMRLYESALIRQTESSLIAEGALAAAAYRNAWRAAGGRPENAGRLVDPRWTHQPGFTEPWLPRFARLDLAVEAVLPPPPDLQPSSVAADEAARRAGEAVAPLIREGQLVTLSGVRVVDRNGVVVASTGEAPALGLSLAAQPEMQRALTGEPVSVLRSRTPSQGFWDRGGAARVFTALPVLDERRVVGAVLAWRTPRSLRDALYGKRRSLAFLGLLTVGAVGAFAALGVAAISRPLRAVTEQAKRTAAGERGAISPPGAASPASLLVVREAAELWEALARMAETLDRRADYIRDFAVHVSHEFKTPLTTIRGTVELLREHLADMTGDERERFLASLDTEAERLARLVSRLLELARADVMVSRPHESCDAVEVAMRFAGNYRGLGLQVEVSAPPSLIVAIGVEGLEMILHNLLNNARRHAGPAAHVSIALSRHGRSALLRVSDDGPGVSGANAERIFMPFFTTARETGGTGLGLSIVGSLARAHRGRLRLAPSQAGAAFEVELPAALREA